MRSYCVRIAGKLWSRLYLSVIVALIPCFPKILRAGKLNGGTSVNYGTPHTRGVGGLGNINTPALPQARMLIDKPDSMGQRLLRYANL
jgi:hypothetical protein